MQTTVDNVRVVAAVVGGDIVLSSLIFNAFVAKGQRRKIHLKKPYVKLNPYFFYLQKKKWVVNKLHKYL